MRTLDDATSWLLTYAPGKLAEADYRLDRMRRLMRLLGDPQEKLRVVHIAGTSGKTSTAYYIRGLLQRAGYKTGLTVSPHIVAINERVQIDGEPLAAARFMTYINEFRALIQDFDDHPSYYELTMALAYWVFAREQVDYAVIETGLGGLLDGSNVVERQDKVCVINVIGLDHVELLGDTIEKIAYQKAGIIHEGNHVFVIDQDDRALRVIRRYAQQHQAPLSVVEPAKRTNVPVFQYGNWALANAVYEYVAKRDDRKALSPQEREIVKTKTPPGRYETYIIRGKTVILDGAHSPQKLAALRATLRADGIEVATVVCAFKEGDEMRTRSTCQEIATFCDKVILDSFTLGQDSKQIVSVPVATMEQIFKQCGVTRITSVSSHREALDMALAGSSAVVITGSLYLVAHIRPLLLKLATN